MHSAPPPEGRKHTTRSTRQASGQGSTKVHLSDGKQHQVDAFAITYLTAAPIPGSNSKNYRRKTYCGGRHGPGNCGAESFDVAASLEKAE